MDTPDPRYATPATPGAVTLGGQVAQLAKSMGKPLMPWQRRVADVALELDESGQRFRYDRVMVSVPRQSGKTTLVQPVMVHRALMIRDGGVWATAQTRNDARDNWINAVKAVRRSPLERFAKIRYTNGSETLEFPSGGSVRLFAPGEDNLHGKTTDLCFIDEIWSLSAGQGAALMQAVIPTQLTRPLSQTWMVSTAGTSRSTFMRPLVNTCRTELIEGRPGRTAYFEWSIPDDADPLDLAVVTAHHPAWGHTVTSARSLEYDPAIMSAAEYARAYGNVWVSSDAFYLSPKLWEAARTHAPIAAASPVAFAVEVYPDRSAGVICAAGIAADGRTVIEVVEFRGHMNWIADRVIDLVRRHRPVAVVIDPYSAARPVHARLSEQRHTQVPLSEPFTAADLVQADAEFVNGIIEGTVAHRSHERLDSALSAATTRSVREQTVIARTGDPETGYPAALIAGMLAAYGLAHPVAQVPAPLVVGHAKT